QMLVSHSGPPSPRQWRRRRVSGARRPLHDAHQAVVASRLLDPTAALPRSRGVPSLRRVRVSRRRLTVVAYFSMEIGVLAEMPTYAGGLGVLAGDTLRSAADMGVPMVGVTLLHRKGYFHQQLDAGGRQIESPEPWSVEQFLVEQPPRVEVAIEGRPVRLRCWRRVIAGAEGEVPVYFLDADLPENAAADRTLTDVLYGGDERYRLCQEILLGIGGVRMLRALGYNDIRTFHMNEGHSALATLALLEEQSHSARGFSEVELETVRRRCVFTTHTPVPAGHDRFNSEL